LMDIDSDDEHFELERNKNANETYLPEPSLNAFSFKGPAQSPSDFFSRTEPFHSLLHSFTNHPPLKTTQSQQNFPPPTRLFNDENEIRKSSFPLTDSCSSLSSDGILGKDTGATHIWKDASTTGQFAPSPRPLNPFNSFNPGHSNPFAQASIIRPPSFASPSSEVIQRKLTFESAKHSVRNRKAMSQDDLRLRMCFDSPEFSDGSRLPTMKVPPLRLRSDEFTPIRRKPLLSPDTPDDPLEGFPELSYISPHKLMQVLKRRDDSLVIVDNRYEYEYSGGHFHDALHLPFREQIDQLYETLRSRMDKKTIVFHCERSICRGPRAAKYFVKLCRQNNTSCLFDVQILEGGYSNFFNSFHCNFYFDKQQETDLKNAIIPVGYIHEYDKSYALRKRNAREKVSCSWKDQE